MRKTIIILSILALTVHCCGQTAKRNHTQDCQGALIIKHENMLSLSESNWVSKSYSYYWLAGKDTLDFELRTTESKANGALHLRLLHKEPMLFTDALKKINACLPLIEEDFDTSKLTTIHFMEPIFYLDLTKKLSSEYEQEFGRKTIGYDKLFPFLLKSSLTSQLDHFLNPLNKKVTFYGLEKFQLIDKENYKEYLPNVDLRNYPEFVLNGYNGLVVNLEEK